MASAAPPNGGGKRPVKKNAFLIFCEEKRRELEAKGTKVPKNGIQGLIELGSPYWEKMTPEEKAPYQERSKMLRGNASTEAPPPPPPKPTLHESDWGDEDGGDGDAENEYTNSIAGSTDSQGYSEEAEEDEEPVQHKKKQETNYQKLRKALELEEFDKQGISKTLYTRIMYDDYKKAAPENRSFLFLHFGTYVATQKHILPAEYCIAEFSLLEGLIEFWGGTMDLTEQVPSGYYVDVMDSKERYGYAMPGFNKEFDYYNDCWCNIYKLVRRNLPRPRKGEPAEPPSIYTMPEDMEIVGKCLRFFMEQTGVEFEYRLKSIHNLMEVLVSETDRIRCERKMERSKDVFAIHKFQTLKYFKNLNLLYGAELACDHHNQENFVEKMHMCSTHIVKTWAYNIMKYICPALGIQMVPDKHYPKFSEGIEQIAPTSEPGESLLLSLTPVELAESLKTASANSKVTISHGPLPAAGVADLCKMPSAGSNAVLFKAGSNFSPSANISTGEDPTSNPISAISVAPPKKPMGSIPEENTASEAKAKLAKDKVDENVEKSKFWREEFFIPFGFLGAPQAGRGRGRGQGQVGQGQVGLQMPPRENELPWSAVAVNTERSCLDLSAPYRGFNEDSDEDDMSEFGVSELSIDSHSDTGESLPSRESEPVSIHLSEYRPSNESEGSSAGAKTPIARSFSGQETAHPDDDW